MLQRILLVCKILKDWGRVWLASVGGYRNAWKAVCSGYEWCCQGTLVKDGYSLKKAVHGTARYQLVKVTTIIMMVVMPVSVFIVLGRSMIVAGIIKRGRDTTSQDYETNRKTDYQTNELLHFISSK